MKQILFLTLFLTACSSDGIPEYVNGRTLTDENGCKFLAKKGTGDVVFLDYAKVKNNCDFDKVK